MCATCEIHIYNSSCHVMYVVMTGGWSWFDLLFFTYNRMCSQLFNKKSYSASLLLRDPLHINLFFRDHDTKIISVFYTCNRLKSNHSYPQMSYYSNYYPWQLSLSTHDHDTWCLWEIFSLSTNISVAIKFSQRWYCTKDSWKIIPLR